jgi:acetyl-CoA synthetase
MDVDVLDADAQPTGEIGELVVRNTWVGMTHSFWRDDERYVDTYWSRWPDTWVHGDLASIDADGYWHIHGRSDDTLKIGGRRVGPSEIESALVAQPGIAEAAVIGVPDEMKGQQVVAFVVARPGAERPQPEGLRDAVTEDARQSDGAVPDHCRGGPSENQERQDHAACDPRPLCG